MLQTSASIPLTERSFKGIFEEYYPSLYHYANRLVNDDQMADDITQEVFVDVWNKREEITLYSTAGYLYTSIRFKCLNYLRSLKKQLHERIDVADTIKDETQDRFYIIEEEFLREIRKVIGTMPEQRQKVFLMHLDGYNQQEIAEELKVSVNTVKTHKLKARQYLQKEIKHTLIVYVLVLFSDSFW